MGFLAFEYCNKLGCYERSSTTGDPVPSFLEETIASTLVVTGNPRVITRGDKDVTLIEIPNLPFVHNAFGTQDDDPMMYYDLSFKNCENGKKRFTARRLKNRAMRKCRADMFGEETEATQCFNEPDLRCVEARTRGEAKKRIDIAAAGMLAFFSKCIKEEHPSFQMKLIGTFDCAYDPSTEFSCLQNLHDDLGKKGVKLWEDTGITFPPAKGTDLFKIATGNEDVGSITGYPMTKINLANAEGRAKYYWRQLEQAAKIAFEADQAGGTPQFHPTTFDHMKSSSCVEGSRTYAAKSVAYVLIGDQSCKAVSME